jgi:ABC-type enterobactin transport system permease subunit
MTPTKKKRRWPAVLLAVVLGAIALGAIGARFSPIWPTFREPGRTRLSS